MKTKLLLKIVFLACLLPQFLFAQVPVSGLVGYFPFNGNTNDHSTFSNHGVATTLMPTADRFGTPGKAFYFNGTTSSVVIPEMYDILPRTISVWFSTDVIDNFSRIIYTSDNSSLNYGVTNIDVWNINGINQLRAPLSGTHIYSKITTNIWYHAVVAVGPDSTYMYLNGARVGAERRISFVHSNNGRNATIIGEPRNSISSSKSFTGSIDDLRIYNRLLTPAEILALYNENYVSGQKEELTSKPVFNIYPNPSEGEITLLVADENSEKNHYIIYNVLGEVILQGDFLGNKKQIHISENLSKGVYFVQVTDKLNQQSTIKKFLLH